MTSLRVPLARRGAVAHRHRARLRESRAQRAGRYRHHLAHGDTRVNLPPGVYNSGEAGAAAGSPYSLAITATDAGGVALTRTLAITVLGTVDALFRSGFDDAASVTACH